MRESNFPMPFHISRQFIIRQGVFLQLLLFFVIVYMKNKRIFVFLEKKILPSEFLAINEHVYAYFFYSRESKLGCKITKNYINDILLSFV